jgi:hypothetical protein
VTPPDIHITLRMLIDGKADRPATVEVIDLAHRIATGYLRSGALSVQALLRRLDLSPQDAAFDSLGELFQRDARGRFSSLVRWWDALSREERTDGDAAGLAFRRLVMGAVQQRIFHFYHESDPALAKVLRNVKLALRKHPCVVRVGRGRHTEIARREVHVREGLPPMPSELLVPDFYDRVASGTSLRDMLTVLVSILAEQRSYRRSIPLMQAALIIRNAYWSDARWRLAEDEEGGITAEEISAIIATAVAGLRGGSLANYIRRGRLTGDQAESHLAAVTEILQETVAGKVGDKIAFYEALQKHIPGLTREAYRTRHRVVLEYLVRSARLGVRELLAQEQ